MPLKPQFRSFSGHSSRFSGPSGGKGCSALPSAAGTRRHTPPPPPRHAALPGGSHAVLRCGRRAWQEGPLAEGSGPSASSRALVPSLMEDPRPPRRSPRTAGGLWGSGESGSPLPCVPPASCSGLALEAAGAPGASWTGSQDFCPALGCRPAFPPHCLYSSLPPLLRSFQVFLSTSLLMVVTAIHPAKWCVLGFQPSV